LLAAASRPGGDLDREPNIIIIIIIILICSEHNINEAQQRANDKTWTAQQGT